MTPALARRAGWIALAALVAVAHSVAHAQAASDARAGDPFLKLADAKAYGETWDAASDLLKKSVSRAEWIAQMEGARAGLGTVAVRLLKDTTLEHDPAGAPPGDYLLLTYETTFTGATLAKTETLPLVRGADGRWRAVGYFVR